jgi:hypothetical protein
VDLQKHFIDKSLLFVDFSAKKERSFFVSVPNGCCDCLPEKFLYPIESSAGRMATYADCKSVIVQDIGAVSGGVHPSGHNRVRRLGDCYILVHGSNLVIRLF